MNDGVEQLGCRGAGRLLLSLQFVDDFHELLHFGDDAALLGEGWETHFHSGYPVWSNVRHSTAGNDVGIPIEVRCVAPEKEILWKQSVGVRTKAYYSLDEQTWAIRGGNPR